MTARRATSSGKWRRGDNYQKTFVSGYALAAIPARYALERRQWQEASAIALCDPADFPWKDFPEVEAMTCFPRCWGRPGTAILQLPERHSMPYIRAW